MPPIVNHACYIDTEDANRYRSCGAWLDVTLYDYLTKNAALYPQREALIEPPNKEDYQGVSPRRLNWCELLAAVNALSRLLQRLGVGHGDVVMVQLPNTWESVAILFAVTRLGGIVSPISSQSRQAELAHAIACLHPVVYVCSRNLKGTDYAAYFEDHLPSFEGTVLAIEDLPELTEPGGSPDLATGAPVKEQPSADDIATICWTSGTEGSPKAVPRTHNNWNASAIGVSEGFGMGTEPEQILLPFPLINTAAIGGVTMPWLYNGGTLVLHQPFELDVLVEQLISEKITVMLAAPTALQAILSSPAVQQAGDALRLRAVGCGSAAPSPSLLRHYEQTLNISIINMFGANEGTLLCSDKTLISDPNDRATLFPRVGTSEVIWPNSAANWLSSRLLDVETGEEITSPGRTGMLLVKGPSIFPGYFGNGVLDRSSFTGDGFFKTGDLFQITQRHGKPHYLKVVGRQKELIIRGGYNISPLEVDAALAEFPDVVELACGGIFDVHFGERLCLYVVLRENITTSLSGVCSFLEAKGLAKTKWPEKIVVIETLPRNALNKVVRAELQNQTVIWEEAAF